MTSSSVRTSLSRASSSLDAVTGRSICPRMAERGGGTGTMAASGTKEGRRSPCPLPSTGALVRWRLYSFLKSRLQIATLASDAKDREPVLEFANLELKVFEVELAPGGVDHSVAHVFTSLERDGTLDDAGLAKMLARFAATPTTCNHTERRE